MKIKHTNLDKILNRCTAKEIDFILEVAQYQDDHGTIKGIKYNDMMQNINISVSTYFKLLYDLEQKEIIKINYHNEEYSFWEFTIIDNDFTDKNYKKGYLNINNDFLHSTEFKKLKRAEKVIVLNLFKIAHNRHYIKITIQTLMKWTNCKIQSIRQYIKSLSKFFNTSKDNNLFTFEVNSYFFRKVGTEKDIRNCHLIDFIVKKNRASKEPNATKEVANLFNQYSKLDPAIIFEIISKSIKQIGILNVKYIHKYLSNHLKYTKLTY